MAWTLKCKQICGTALSETRVKEKVKGIWSHYSQIPYSVIVEGKAILPVQDTDADTHTHTRICLITSNLHYDLI